MLATSYIFKEVTPNVFAHNRNSALIDTGKTWDEIKARYKRNAVINSSVLKFLRPLEKYSQSNGFAAAIGFGYVYSYTVTFKSIHTNMISFPAQKS